jgi:hypothetical protein
LMGYRVRGRWVLSSINGTISDGVQTSSKTYRHKINSSFE